jgi:Protein of unknown function (DUF3172)
MKVLTVFHKENPLFCAQSFLVTEIRKKKTKCFRSSILMISVQLSRHLCPRLLVPALVSASEDTIMNRILLCGNSSCGRSFRRGTMLTLLTYLSLLALIRVGESFRRPCHSDVYQGINQRALKRSFSLRFDRKDSRDRDYFDPEGDGDDDFNDGSEDEIESRFNERFPDSRRRPPGPGRRSKTVVKGELNRWEVINRAVIAGAFVAGIGSGIGIDSAINTNPKDLASRDAVDRNAPNPKICQKYGASAMVLDQRVFVTFNPFNVSYNT